MAHAAVRVRIVNSQLSLRQLGSAICMDQAPGQPQGGLQGIVTPMLQHSFLSFSLFVFGC